MPSEPMDREMDLIAVVGMAGRFPHAESLEAFWRNLREGKECISFFSEEELREAGVDPALLADPRYVRAKSMLEGLDLFDAGFFGFNPREAEVTNPQNRLFLECSWHALEDAGVDPAAFPGAVGVFASASSNSYGYDLFTRPDIFQSLGGVRIQIANEKEFLPTWVSYKLDLRGPSVNVQTACSSSLVAVHMACQSLLNGECDLALAGGVSVRNLARGGYLHQEGGILSPDGHCRAFDAAAAGTVNGDGVGVVVLKRLAEALEDGDNVHAVIRGSAVNNDGALKVGFTAPGQEGQTRVVAEALSIAGVDPESVGYVEAHGTGTRLGDPIEVSALTEAFRARTDATGFCALGSVKTAIGHLDAAAGIAGLIRAVLALKHRLLPPSLHFREPNPEIDFAGSPFYVSSAAAPWRADGGPRRAGVSSFGIGGTNAHVILEEAPEPEAGPSREWQLLVWSARSEAAADGLTASLARALGGEEPPALADAAHTLRRGRRAFGHRRALVCREVGEAAAALANGDAQWILAGLGPARPRPVAFLFPGQGAQKAGATHELYEREEAFRSEVDRCAALLRPQLGADLREALYPRDGGREEAERRLAETAWTQPAVFVTGWALARLWMSWGVKPEALIGHSLGEYVAACLAGVLRLEDALALVAARGRLMQALPPGGMLAVPLGEDEVTPLLSSDLSLAAVNAPRRVVVSGPFEALAELEAKLSGRGVEGKRLRTSHAFHSRMMDPALPAFAERLRAVAFQAPRIPYIANVTGDWIAEEQAADPGFWLRQLREPVRFGEGAGRLLRERDWALLEVGPGRTLTTLVRQHPDLREGHAVVASLAPHGSDSETAALLDALGRLWAAGADVDWSGLDRGERRRKASLPAYPFERHRYWIEKKVEKKLDVKKEIEMSEAVPTASPEALRHEGIVQVLKEVVHDLTGMDVAQVDAQASFLDVGVDSLLLIQATQRLQDRVGVKLSVVQLLEELTTLDSVAAYVAQELPADKLAALVGPAVSAGPPAPVEAAAAVAPDPQPAVPVLTQAAPVATPRPVVAGSTLEQLLAQQLQILSQQLQVLQGAAAPATPAPVLPVPVKTAPVAAPPVTYTRFGPYHPIEAGPQGGLTPRQQAYLDRFIRRYTARTAKSKELTQAFRPVLADSRGTVAFRRLWKELVYPIHGERSKGSRLWDVDGNEYVDINMGFGLHFFGHSPDFLVEAMERQMRQGLELGPQSPLAGRVAGLVCELTGMDRAIFCNSGTEAVMGALRAARTYTRRSKVALLSNSYHGWADTTLVRTQAVQGRQVSVPGAPGVSAKALEDVVVFDYDSPEALEQIAAMGSELAAVLVEPVRSRSPELQPREFLHRLREITAQTGTVLIFDEMVTGFRCHPGGAQAWFGVEADLATYGKLIAGGLAIGVLAGRAAFMDVLDGGMWSFGDDSYPQAEKTMFAGAFFKHPLTMAASFAVLDRMRQEGPGLHEELNARTARLAADLNDYFQGQRVPMEAVHFGSLFRFRPLKEMQHAELFFFHLVDHGVFYTQESGNCFVTTAHTDDDLQRVKEAVRLSVEDLREGGFLPEGPSGPPRGRREPTIEILNAPAVQASPALAAAPVAASSARGLDLSLYYFGTYEARYDPAKYDLLIEGARFADRHGFSGLWLPERHFHAFGGFSPNPSVLAAALARETKRLHLRAGSVVVPLHHPVRLAEEWSLVDNLSGGRIGVSFASGWHANDFVFAPQHFERRHEVMYEGIEKIRALWRGEALRVRDGAGKELEVVLHPLPCQREIPVWLTSASTETFARAGAMGVGVLTNLQTQSLDELTGKVQAYYEALARHGHDPAAARVTLLLHAFVGPDLEEVRHQAAGPLRGYLRSSLSLTRKMLESRGRNIDFDRLSEKDLDYLLGAAYDRYAADHALIGTPATCAPVLDRLKGIGVTEVGCLVDFGIDVPVVLDGLSWLDRVREGAAVPRTEAPIVVTARTAVRELPMTAPHRALWLAAQMGADASRAYNEPMALRLRGPLDLPALRAALQRVVDRHEALRATFSPDGTRQRIAASLRLEIPVTDLSGLGEAVRETAARAWTERQVREPFDLVQGPLIRCGVARLAADEHLLALTMHHLIMDGHSGGVMLRELSRLYAAAVRGEACDLGEAPRFDDSVARLTREEQGSERRAAEEYWTALFAEPVAPLDLPKDRSRPRTLEHAGSRRRLPLSPSLVEGLRQLGKGERATLFMTALAAYGFLLHRLTGQDDLVVGVPSRDAAAGGAVGYFISLMPLRFRTAGTAAFRDYLRQVKRVLLEGQAHQPCPLDRLFERNGRSLVTATFNVERGGEPPRLLGLEAEIVRVDLGTARFEIHLNLIEDGATPLVELSYRSGLFDAATADRWLLQLERLLRTVVADPETPLADSSLLPEAERHQVLLEWNDTAAVAPAPGPVHRLFEEQARRTPQAVALTAGGSELTYAELDRRASRVAGLLRQSGAAPGSRVGLLAERSVDQIAAVLGIWKAGGAYVPLDPSLPTARLALLAEDSGPAALVTEKGLAELAGSLLAGAPLVLLDDARTRAAEAPEDAAPSVASAPGDPAYVIYTSGTTGNPKGVVVEHGNLAHTMRASREAFGFAPGDRMPCLAPFSFDIFLFEVMGPLLGGGTVDLFALRPTLDLPGLLAALERMTLLHAVPAVMRQVVEAARRRGGFPGLRRAFVGGEAVPPDLLAEMREAFPAAAITILYGPTEGTIIAASCETGGAAPAGRNLIGRPLPDNALRVCGRNGGPVGIGAAGELWIGGPGVTRGYLGREELTAEKLVERDGERWYRTGDLARHLPDGRLEFLGRIDQQVKVRGFRIELGEIEAVLAAHPAVREAAVLVVEDEAGEKRLAAFLAAQEGQAPSASELSAHAAAKLPDYMVPASWTVLGELPLTPHGKVDRRALARLMPAEPGTAAYLAPRTRFERLLAGLWQQVLRVERVGVQDDFFALGGDSIKVAALTNLLQERLEENVWVVALFDAPTVERLALYLQEHYPAAVARLTGEEPAALAAPEPEPAGGPVEPSLVERFQAMLKAPRTAPERRPRNRRAVFVLSPPRSGSTLLRVMLAGHPGLFAPPELELLGFQTLRERRDTFSGRDSLWAEGTIRALMALRGCDADEARRAMEEMEERDFTIQAFYGELQKELGDRLLVDKTPSYALDLEVLRRAEEEFEEPLYIHLLRHPGGMIASFEEARLEQVFFRQQHGLPRRQVAELTWLVSHQNILEHLRDVPAGRQLRVRFEDLVRQPRETLERICGLLGIDFHPGMLEPYGDQAGRMTDGIHPLSKMVGDVKFHQHSGVDPRVADRWRERIREESLGGMTREMAASFGYGKESEPREPRQAWTRIPAAPRTPEAPIPLSFAQQRLWFLDQLAPGSAAYNMPAAVRVTGPLDTAALSLALSEVVRRHESLRTTFVARDGEASQVIHPAASVPLPVTDLRHLPEAERLPRARDLAREESLRPFDLSRGPLLRAGLLALGEREHVLLLTLHHIIGDAWSMGLLVSELGALYDALSHGRPSPLPEPEIQFADFAHWQRSWLSGERLEAELGYWKEQLAGSPPVLQMPTDRPRPAFQTFHGDDAPIQLPAELAGAVRGLCRQYGATPFMALLAVWQLLLARHSGQDDVVVGTAITGRSHVQTEKLIGFFANTLVLRSRIGRAATFGELLDQVRGTALGAFAHQDLPFEKLVEELHLERDLRYAPIFQAVFAFQNAPLGTANVREIHLEPLQVESRAAKFDLSFALADAGERMAGTLNYNTDLFDRETVEHLLRRYAVLLAAAVHDPRRPLPGLPMLTAEEERELLVDWNDTAVPASEIPLDGVAAQFERQAAKTPGAVAIVAGETRLTYRQLNERTNQLAHLLQRWGVRPEVRVGICLDRSALLPVALLATLKAGGAYVPLDPTYPAERLAFMAEDTQIEVLLTEERLAGAVPVSGIPVLRLDSEWEEVARESLRNPRPLAGAENLAYIIYTSGSTGRPKGVQVLHRGLAHFLGSFRRTVGSAPGDVVVAVSSPSFDVTGLDLYLPLLTGARVVLASREQALDGRKLAELLAGSGATVLQATPTTWRLLLEAGWTGTPGLKAFCGAEPLQPALAASLLERTGTLWNLYGPTESTVWATVDPIVRPDDVTVGRPIANTRLYLVDRHGSPVPAGVPGELWIGGLGVSRGYCRRPDLTADKFIPDPFGGLAGDRLYRTGDLARYRPDGRLEFLGRTDHQVKVRGFRIELGEIEAVLASHPGVKQGIAMVRGEGADARLVACVVAEGEEVPAEELRRHLHEQLPEHMVPSLFATLEALPLLPNGKVDRGALSRLDLTGERAAAAAFVAPRTPVEEELARIWEELLAVRPVGVRDSFFELGGHSLLSVRLMAAVQSRFGRELPLATLFQEPTIEHLARCLEAGGEARPGSPLVAIQPDGSGLPFFCVHPIGGGALTYRHMARHLGTDQPFYGLQAPGLDSAEAAAHASIEEMAAAYLEAVREVQPQGPYLLGGASFGGVVAFEMAQQLRESGEEVGLLALFDTFLPLGREAADLDLTAVLAALARERARQDGKELRLTADDLHRLPEEERFDAVLARLRELDIVGEEIDTPWLRRFLEGYASRRTAMERYRAEPYEGAIALFRARETDPEHVRQAPPEQRGRYQDPTLGWSTVAAADRIEVHHVPGYHETMTAEPHVRELARALKTCIERAAGVEAGSVA